MNVTVDYPPLDAKHASELTALWESTLGAVPSRYLPILRGDENSANRFAVYEAREDGRLAGTCTLTTSIALPTIGGLGEVATHPDFRRRGIARQLCEAARDDFASSGGTMLFLATSNAGAARLYRSLGWQRLANANVMLLSPGEDLPEARLIDHHREPIGGVTVSPGSAADRVTMIPLLLSPLDGFVLDANTRLMSIRQAPQGSCMGLYPRYEGLREEQHGEWFVARASDGRPLGIASAKPLEKGVQVDAFTLPHASDHWDMLLEAVLQWARRHGDRPHALVCEHDTTKLACMARHGLSPVKTAETWDVGGQPVKMLRIEA